MRERAPRHAALVSRETATWRDVARRLSADEAFIEYLVSDASSLAFVVTRDTAVAVQLGVGPPRPRPADRLRARHLAAARARPALDSLWRAPLRQLHRDLIAPIEASGLLRGEDPTHHRAARRTALPAVRGTAGRGRARSGSWSSGTS